MIRPIISQGARETLEHYTHYYPLIPNAGDRSTGPGLTLNTDGEGTSPGENQSPEPFARPR